MNKAASISIIVPVLNEAAQLPGSLASIGALDGSVQLIVVDGGSTDDSLAVARRCGAETLVSPIRQRAAQMNLGAESAAGDVLLFLHADTRLPANWRGILASEMQRDAACVGGAFRRRFDFRRLSSTLRAGWRTGAARNSVGFSATKPCSCGGMFFARLAASPRFRSARTWISPFV